MKKLEVKSINGEKLDLNQLYNSTHLLLIFYNNQCLGCTGRALPLAYEFTKKFKNIQVIGIHVDFSNREINEDEIVEIFTSKTLPFPIYKDIDLNLYDHFRCEGTPHWILLNKNRKVVNSIFGSQAAAHNRLLYAIEELEG